MDSTEALYVRTPLIESFAHAGESGKRRVFYKMENVQPAGSFKTRGMTVKAQHAVKNGAKKLIIASGGNAGMAVAYAAHELRVECVVVVPQSTSRAAAQRIEVYGARVLVHGAAWDDAAEHARELADNDDTMTLMHPFDDELAWRGHSTLVDEIARDWAARVASADALGAAPEAVVVACGGGGLLCGVYEGLERVGWLQRGTQVVAVETAGAASLAAAVAAGELVELPAITSCAKTLGARRVAQRALDVAQSAHVSVHTVTDGEAVRAAAAFADEQRALVEPSCGAALAALNTNVLKEKQSVVIVICGGAGIDRATMDQLMRDYGNK